MLEFPCGGIDFLRIVRYNLGMDKKFLATAALLSFILVGCMAPETIPIISESEPESTDFAEITNWSVEFSRDNLADQALNVAHYYFKNNRGVESEINFYFEQSVSEGRKLRYSELTKLTTAIFHNSLNGELNVIAGTTQAFMTETLYGNNISTPLQVSEGTNSLCGIEVWEDDPSGCTWNNTVWYGFGKVPDKEYGALHNVAPHETFHAVSHQLAGGTPQLNDAPIWFIEGTAEFFGYAITDYTGHFAYEDLATLDWYYLPDPATGLEFWNRQPVRNMPLEWYTIGQIATEYMVVNSGVDEVLAIYENIGRGMDFSEAFEESMGISLFDFYVRFDIGYKKMVYQYDGPIKTYKNRNCLDGWDCSITNYKNLEWWQLIPSDVSPPERAESSDPNVLVEIHRVTPQVDRCLGPGGLENFVRSRGGTIAISFEARDRAGLGEDVLVSTEWYMMQSALDSNSDGVVCGPEDSGVI